MLSNPAILGNRRKTREVLVGDVGIGANNPIRIQSMTTSNTRDIIATAEQIMRLADAGCELARVTVQGKSEAKSCESIKNLLLQKNYTIPIVADIHFYPPAAMLVADFVEKIRINPGNFCDRRANFKTIEYTDETYNDEISKIEESLTPLVEKCIKLKRALRIGTNHGSLSDRIMSRYGDTPFGMVESALEFARVCRKLDYHNFLFSMKASNPIIMIQAYRLLVKEMDKIGWDYPLHLGVTEAGDGEDGRVKSAIGIGSLLFDGLGDTIRVSLTEDPWLEIDPCQRLIKLANEYKHKNETPFVFEPYLKRGVERIAPLHRDGSVILYGSPSSAEKSQADAYYIDNRIYSDKGSIGVLDIPGEHKSVSLDKNCVPYIKDSDPNSWQKILELENISFILLDLDEPYVQNSRRFFKWLQKNRVQAPVILVGNYLRKTEADVVIRASAEIGALLADGYGDGIMLKTDFDATSLSFNILQGCRMRATKTEFIACPSCGRTLFNLQEVTQKIRAKTSHLPGVKIAIMGCIVNGPGEMADADFGYVGSGPELIDLYVGKERVERGIHFSVAEEKLIQLIKDHGRWIEKTEPSQV